jgi:hypothetical protein
MLIIPETLRSIVDNFSHSDRYVCKTAMEGFTELVKHGNYQCILLV